MADKIIDKHLADCRLIVTAGCGGVGKTTLAAALATTAARNGRRVAIITIDPARRLAQALGLINGLTHEPQLVTLNDKYAGQLSAMMLDTKRTIDQMVIRYSTDEASAHRLLNNRYYGFFSTSLAGTLEYMAVEQVRILVEESDYDLVILDTPPAAHALEFLDAPERLLSGLNKLPLKTISKGGREGISGRLARQGRHLVLRGLDKLTGGPFINDLAEFLGEFRNILEALQEAGRSVRTLLRAETTRFYLITSPQPARLDEAAAFLEQLKQRSLPLGGIIINRVQHQIPHDTKHVFTRESLRENLSRATTIQLTDKQSEEMLQHLAFVLHEHNRLAKRDAMMCDTIATKTGVTPLIAPRVLNHLADPDELYNLAGKIVRFEVGTSN